MRQNKTTINRLIKRFLMIILVSFEILMTINTNTKNLIKYNFFHKKLYFIIIIQHN